MEVLWTVLTRVRPVAISEQNISFTDNHKIQLKAVSNNIYFREWIIKNSNFGN